MQSVARPSSAGLRAARSEGNLPNAEMQGGGIEGLRGVGGSAPWLVDNRKTRLNAAQNRYIHTVSSIFGDESQRDAIRCQRGKQALADLQQQVLAREESKLREKAEERRLYDAMALPTTYDPSIRDAKRDPGERERQEGAMPQQDTAAVVSDVGGYTGGSYGGGGGSYSVGGGSYGGGGGSYDGGGSYGGGGGSYSGGESYGVGGGSYGGGGGSYDGGGSYGGGGGSYSGGESYGVGGGSYDGGGGSYGVGGSYDGGGGSYSGGESYGVGGGSYDVGGGSYGVGGGSYGAPTSHNAPGVGGMRRLPRHHVSMTSDEREAVNAARADQLRGELQWQVQMKRQLDEEKRKKEALEDQLYEESIRRQQEKMNQEYEAELEKKRKKEEERNRRRDAQLRQMEMMHKQAEQERKDQLQRVRQLGEATASNPLPATDTGPDARTIHPAKQNQHTKRPNAPVKMAKGNEDRKRPKPLSPPPAEGHLRMNRGNTPGLARYHRKQQPHRPRTTLALGSLGGAPPTPAVRQPHQKPPAASVGPMTLAVPEASFAPGSNRGSGSDVGVHKQEVQSPGALNKRLGEEQKRHGEGGHVLREVPFDWKIKISEPSQEQKLNIEHMSQEEIKQFQENNRDLLSQLLAMKTDLRASFFLSKALTSYGPN
ncbi:uncharacterized protein [Panulirus ornatus]|uniref:uncharacterized protein n=1 Tax=Panulirus ornatus TaxID=150431 RepID=UPI003A86252B